MNTEQPDPEHTNPDSDHLLPAPRGASLRRARPSSSPVISFRLEPEHASLLSERAARLGVSPHEMARHYVSEALVASEEMAALAAAVNAGLYQLQEMRQDLALSVKALLVSAGRVGKAQAHTWVEETLNRP